MAISWVVQAMPARLLSTMSNRMRGEAPKAVALRRKVGVKSGAASIDTSRSTRTLHSAYAVCGCASEVSVRTASAPAPYTLQEEL